MNTRADKSQKKKDRSVANHIGQKRNSNGSASQLLGYRPDGVSQKGLQGSVHNSSPGMKAVQLKKLAVNYTDQKHQLIQKKSNDTGLPDQLKEGVEQQSGISLDDVMVHYNSAKPAELNAHAYAQGANIHVAPGQQKHLPHEAWHVVQQKQGRVKPTGRLGNVSINDDSILEKEADVMGEISAQHITLQRFVKPNLTNYQQSERVIQRLSVKDTNWNSATEAKVTEGSGQGVAIISDGAEAVVVKGNQGWGNEVVVISELMNMVLQSNAGNEFLEDTEYAEAITSKARLIKENEIIPIKEKVKELAPETSEPIRKKNVINDIGILPTVVYSYAPGKDYEDILAEYKVGLRKVTEKKGIRGNRSPRADAKPITQLWTDPGQMQQLGMASAVDIVSGNGDRLLRYFNPKNFRLDEQNKKLVLIDNVAKGAGVYLYDTILKNGDSYSSKESFRDWANFDFVAPFIEGNDAVIANKALNNFTNNFHQEFRAEDQAYINSQIKLSIPHMKRWFRNGLAAGRASLGIAKYQMDRFASGVPDEIKNEFKINLLCRLLAIELKTTDYEYLREAAKTSLGLNFEWAEDGEKN